MQSVVRKSFEFFNSLLGCGNEKLCNLKNVTAPRRCNLIEFNAIWKYLMHLSMQKTFRNNRNCNYYFWKNEDIFWIYQLLASYQEAQWDTHFWIEILLVFVKGNSAGASGYRSLLFRVLQLFGLFWDFWWWFLYFNIAINFFRFLEEVWYLQNFKFKLLIFFLD